MEGLKDFLQNLKPGGASKIPKSKFDQALTEDSEIESPEIIEKINQNQPEINNSDIKSETKNQISKKPRKGLTKQLADIQQDSMEFVEIDNNQLKSTEDVKQIAPSPIPRKKKIPKINEPENEQIEKLWKDLNIGDKGYLTLNELEKVCSYLGMNTLDQKDLKTLFSKIDTDHDGRVTLSEFSVGLKEYGNIQNSEIFKLNLSRDSTSGLFRSLDLDKKGFCEAKKIVELWASGGILNGNEVLEYFDFSMHSEVNLIRLSLALEKGITFENLNAVTLAGIITYRKELYYCRSMLNKLQTEIDKIRSKQFENPNPELIHQKESSNDTFLMKSGEIQDNLNKLTEELSVIAMENIRYKERILELENVNQQQIEELDAVAELHRKMELELKICHDEKNQFGKTFTNEKDFEEKLLMAEKQILFLEKDLEIKSQECESLKTSMENQNRLIDNQLLTIKSISSEKTDRNESGMDHYSDQSKNNKMVLDLQSENETLKRKILALNSKMEIAINREQQYQIKIKEKELKENKFIEIEEKLNETIEKLSNENRKNERKLNSTLEKLVDLEKEKDFLVNSMETLEDELDKSKQSFKQEKENLKRKCQSLENQLNQNYGLQAQLDLNNAEIQTKNNIINKLEEANDRLAISVKNAISKLDFLSRNDLDINRNQLIKENIQIQKENISLEDQINQLKKKLQHNDISQPYDLNKEIRNLESDIKKKNNKIDELEDRIKRINRESPSSSSSHKKSFKKFDHLQFQYDELNKKYQIQLEQVDKTDALLKELYESNTNLLKSLKKMEEQKDKSDLNVTRLEERIKSLQSILDRR